MNDLSVRTGMPE